jgi:hypothetical protein
MTASQMYPGQAITLIAPERDNPRVRGTRTASTIATMPPIRRHRPGGSVSRTSRFHR